jgi:hypothetical protein
MCQWIITKEKKLLSGRHVLILDIENIGPTTENLNVLTDLNAVVDTAGGIKESFAMQILIH